MSSYITAIHGVTLTPEGEILVASREGAFRSTDSGATWEHVVKGIPDKNISSITYDQSKKRLSGDEHRYRRDLRKQGRRPQLASRS